MRNLRNIIILFTGLLCFLVACQKWTDPPAKTDPRLSNLYCNDPEAVNYNWGFPGTPNDSVCYYPADMYKGKYFFLDSVYLSNNVYSYAYATSVDTYLYIYPLSKTQIAVVGFCKYGDTLKFTVDRALHAQLDSSVTLGRGQPFCSLADTATGGISQDITDSSGTHFLVDIAVAGDTGINYHRGVAIKK